MTVTWAASPASGRGPALSPLDTGVPVRKSTLSQPGRAGFCTTSLGSEDSHFPLTFSVLGAPGHRLLHGSLQSSGYAVSFHFLCFCFKIQRPRLTADASCPRLGVSIFSAENTLRSPRADTYVLSRHSKGVQGSPRTGVLPSGSALQTAGASAFRVDLPGPDFPSAPTAERPSWLASVTGGPSCVHDERHRAPGTWSRGTHMQVPTPCPAQYRTPPPMKPLCFIASSFSRQTQDPTWSAEVFHRTRACCL